MDSELTLVTAFFDIGRGELNDESLKYLQRSNDKYFSYFEHWARMKNMLIAYTEPRFADRIYQVRESFGLRDKTRVIVIDDVYSIEPEMIKRMKKIECNTDFRCFRYYSDAFSNTANYDYIMMMKYWFLKDAADKKLLNRNVAWIDFGFDHGGELYPDSKEFSYLWDYDFSNKIHLFSIEPPDRVSAIDSLQLFPEVIMGAPVVASSALAHVLWDLIRDAMNALLMLDSIDDDQQLLLMAYKARPDLFEIHISQWFLPLKQFGGGHLNTLEKNDTAKAPGILAKAKSIVRSVISPQNNNKKDFLKRTVRRVEKYQK